MFVEDPQVAIDTTIDEGKSLADDPSEETVEGPGANNKERIEENYAESEEGKESAGR